MHTKNCSGVSFSYRYSIGVFILVFSVLAWNGEFCFGVEEGALRERSVAVAVELPKENSQSSNRPREISVFCGTTLKIEWLIRGEEAGKGDYAVDLHRMLTSTLAPIEKDQDLENRAKDEQGVPFLGLYSVSIPQSEVPVSFLVKLWKREKGKKKAISIVAVRGIPDSIFADLKGTEIGYHAAKGHSQSFRSFLEDKGLRIKELSEYPSSQAPDISVVETEGEEEIATMMKGAPHSSFVVLIRKPGFVGEESITEIFHREDSKIAVIDSLAGERLAESPERQRQIRDLLSP